MRLLFLSGLGVRRTFNASRGGSNRSPSPSCSDGLDKPLSRPIVFVLLEIGGWEQIEWRVTDRMAVALAHPIRLDDRLAVGIAGDDR